MKDNATFIEFATFFFIIAFSVTMTKMQWDHNDNVVQNKVDRELKIQNDADQILAWYDRITRIQSIGIIDHDGDPNTNLFDVIIDASSYVDPDKDFISSAPQLSPHNFTDFVLPIHIISCTVFSFI